MHATVLDRTGSRGRWSVLVGVLLSIAAHAVVLLEAVETPR